MGTSRGSIHVEPCVMSTGLLETWLSQNGFGDYTAKITELGCTEVADLEFIPLQDLEQIGIKGPRARRFLGLAAAVKAPDKAPGQKSSDEGAPEEAQPRHSNATVAPESMGEGDNPVTKTQAAYLGLPLLHPAVTSSSCLNKCCSLEAMVMSESHLDQKVFVVDTSGRVVDPNGYHSGMCCPIATCDRDGGVDLCCCCVG